MIYHRDELLEEIKEERERQIFRHGFDASRDDQYKLKELAYAAAVYATGQEKLWPWNSHYTGKKDSYRHRIITAASLLLAELERLDRAYGAPLDKEEEGTTEDEDTTGIC